MKPGRRYTRRRGKFTQHYPEPGWVEHDAEEIWASQETTLAEVLARSDRQSIAGLGISNQRETTVVWDAASGEAVCNAIVWQDRRTAERCARLKEEGREAEVTARTGLRLDPYFSASKVEWILDHVEGARGKGGGGRAALWND